MTTGLKRLFIVELRRQWTIAAFFIPIGLAVLAVFITMVSSRFLKIYDVARQAVEVNQNLVIPIAACLFTAGAVMNDVKDGWLRTLLIRPVARQQYLLIKLLTLSCSVLLTVLIAGVLPQAVIAAFVLKIPMRFDLLSALSVYGLMFLHAVTLVSILVFLSCWLPGVFNIAVLAMWAMVASIVGGYLQYAHWMDRWLVLLREFLFPSGFTDAVGVIVNSMGTPVAEVLWGLASLALFLAAAFWSITRIQVDRGSE